MKVLLVNGSPHREGCTYTGLKEVAGVLEAAGIETEIFQVGVQPLSGCIACGGCSVTKRCAIKSDRLVNEFLEKSLTADGFIFGSPVHYAGISGGLNAFLDRVFFAGSFQFRGKPGAAVVSARRGGASSTFDAINKYFTIAEMPVVSSQYWNSIHGNTPEQVLQDAEGMQTMRVLGRNMTWLLKSIEAGRQAGIQLPEQEERHWTNFIR